jgi:hypothetical protein
MCARSLLEKGRTANTICCCCCCMIWFPARNPFFDFVFDLCYNELKRFAFFSEINAPKLQRPELKEETRDTSLSDVRLFLHKSRPPPPSLTEFYTTYPGDYKTRFPLFYYYYFYYKSTSCTLLPTPLYFAKCSRFDNPNTVTYFVINRKMR